MITNIALKDLVLSPRNVRKTPPSDAAEAELKASLRAHGLLENLVVCKTQGPEVNEGPFEVLAGGRRLMALKALAGEGALPDDHPVPCLVHEGDPGEVSLAENMIRLSMHALDQFEAFTALADQGLSACEIAHRFGHSEHLVRQRLRLGRVAPQIRDAYRADAINLDTLMAFAVTEDHADQVAVWEEINGGYVHAHQVRRQLTEGKIAANSRYVRFVGQDAYEAAGGTLMRDLFSEGDEGLYLEDRPLVMRLVQDKLTAAGQDIQTSEGWKWVQTAPDIPYEAISECQHVYPQSIDPTPEQEAEMERLQERLEFYEARDDEQGLSPEDEEAMTALEDKLTAMEDSLRIYTPDDLARAGCMVSVGHDGEISVRRGMVLPEDQQVEEDAEPDAPATYSRALVDDLGYFQLNIAQTYLAQDFDCAFDLMLFTLAHGTLQRGRLWDKPLALSVETTLPHNWAERSGGTEVEVPDDIDIGWLELSPVEGLNAVAAMPMATKQRLFAHCTALSLQGRLAEVGGKDLHGVIGERLGIDVAAHWRPTAEAFFKRIRKDRALEIASEILGDAWARTHRDDKKASLAETLETLFSGQRTAGVTAEQASIAARWLPEGMAYSDDPDVSDPEVEDLPEVFRLPAAE